MPSPVVKAEIDNCENPSLQRFAKCPRYCADQRAKGLCLPFVSASFFRTDSRLLVVLLSNNNDRLIWDRILNQSAGLAQTCRGEPGEQPGPHGGHVAVEPFTCERPRSIECREHDGVHQDLMCHWSRNPTEQYHKKTSLGEIPHHLQRAGVCQGRIDLLVGTFMGKFMVSRGWPRRVGYPATRMVTLRTQDQTLKESGLWVSRVSSPRSLASVPTQT